MGCLEGFFEADRGFPLQLSTRKSWVWLDGLLALRHWNAKCLRQNLEVSLLVSAGLPPDTVRKFVKEIAPMSDAELSIFLRGKPDDFKVFVRTAVQIVREGAWGICSAFVDLDDDGDLATCMIVGYLVILETLIDNKWRWNNVSLVFGFSQNRAEGSVRWNNFASWAPRILSFLAVLGLSSISSSRIPAAS